MIRFFILLFILCPLSSIAQEEVLQITDPLPKKNQFIRESYAVNDIPSKNTALFFKSRTGISAHLYDEAFNEITQLQFDIKLERSESIIGDLVRDNNIELVIWDVSTGKFKGLVFDFSSQSTVIRDYDFDLSDQLIMDTFRGEEGLAFLSVNVASTQIQYHTLSAEGKHATIDFEIDDVFYDEKGDEISLFYGALLGQYTVAEPGKSLSKGDALSLFKIFKNDDRITISLDQNTNLVNLIHLSLDTETVDYQMFSRPQLNTQSEFHDNKANSYLHKDVIYQVISNPLNITFSATKITDSTLVKVLHIEKEKEISFESTEMIMDVGRKKKPVKNSAQFLRNVSGSMAFPCITVQDQNENTVVTLGGGQWAFAQPDDLQSTMTKSFGLVGLAVSSLIKPSSVRLSDNRFVSDISTISFGLDHNFNIATSTAPVSPIDEINVFSKGRITRSNDKRDLLFEKNGSYYYGHLNDDGYTFWKF